MKTYALEAPTPPLAALVEEVKRGEEIVLTDHHCPVAKLTSLVQAGRANGQGGTSLKAGCLKGFWMAADFDEPLADFRDYME
jgi:antitoxin (DNA-binding transcriptional repressor) of toxin-antitoxin stability system